MKKKLWIFLLIPVFIGVGFSSWVISKSDKTSIDIKNDYDVKSVLEKYYGEEQVKEYTGLQLRPTKNNSITNYNEIDEDTLDFSYVPASSNYSAQSNEYVLGSPINSGYYLVRITDKISEQFHTVKFRISPKVIYVKNSFSIELNYSASNYRTFNGTSGIVSSITNVEFTDDYNNQTDYSFDSYVVLGMDNGMYYYVNTAIDSTYSAQKNSYVSRCTSLGYISTQNDGASNVVGSTYAVKLYSTNPNVAIGNSCILKYKTAKIGDAYYTIEDAINLDSPTIINFEGDSTNSTSYVSTCFCALTNENPYSDYNFTYNVSKNIVVNYQAGTSITYGEKNGTSSGGNVYSALIIPSGVTLNLNNGTQFVCNATLGYKQPDTSVTLARGVVVNNGTINLSGTLKSYGYIKGTGNINCLNGSQVYEVLRTYDWPGGNTAYKTYEKLMPINAWSAHNVSCNTKLCYGSKMYAEYFGYEGQIKATPLIVSSNTSDNCVFIIKDSNSFIIKKATNAVNDPDNVGLLYVNGSNQILGQKDVVELYGQFQDASFSLKVYSSATISTSTNIGLPLGFFSIHLKGLNENNELISSNLSLSKSDFIFMPGTELVVEAGTTLNNGNNVDLIFETVNHIQQVNSGQYTFYNKCVDKFDAKMIINGTVNSTGSISGLVETNSSSAILVTGSNFKTTSFYVLHTGVGGSGTGDMAYQVTNMYSKAYINQNTTYYNFLASKTYTSNGSYFIGTAGTITGDALDGTYNKAGVTQSSSCILPNTLITLSDGTQKEAKHIKSGDLLKVFNHETGQYDVSPVLFNDYEESALVKVIYAKFSNGKEIGIVSEHGFFDLDTMRYEYITENNYLNFINHRFYGDNGEIVTLVDAYYKEEFTEVYSPVTYYHLNFFTEGILSIPGGITGLFNIFEYGETLQYDQEKYNNDINTYGLFTYEDLAPLGVTEMMFDAYAGKYLKVALGKGILTEEYLVYLIERYSKYTL